MPKLDDGSEFSGRQFSYRQIIECIDSQSGLCIYCGEERDCCEPDARNYKCDECGNKQVFGAEEIVQMGLCNE